MAVRFPGRPVAISDGRPLETGPSQVGEGVDGDSRG